MILEEVKKNERGAEKEKIEEPPIKKLKDKKSIRRNSAKKELVETKENKETETVSEENN